MATKKQAKEKRFWKKWNLDYTKRVLEINPAGQMAQSLLSCWPAHVQSALRKRFSL